MSWQQIREIFEERDLNPSWSFCLHYGEIHKVPILGLLLRAASKQPHSFCQNITFLSCFLQFNDVKSILEGNEKEQLSTRVCPPHLWCLHFTPPSPYRSNFLFWMVIEKLRDHMDCRENIIWNTGKAGCWCFFFNHPEMCVTVTAIGTERSEIV